MSINEYIVQLESVINAFPMMSAYNLNIDRKTEDITFISGKIEFRNGSILDFKEFIENAGYGVEKYKYAYNYRILSDNIFRYDNAPDPNAKGHRTFPHHKHLKSGEIVESHQIELTDVLKEIEEILIRGA